MAIGNPTFEISVDNSWNSITSHSTHFEIIVYSVTDIVVLIENFVVLYQPKNLATSFEIRGTYTLIIPH